MLLLVGIDPMQFAATCDACGARLESLLGTRSEIVSDLVHRCWRIEVENKGLATMCPDCAGPPSVFPVAQVAASSQSCSACGAKSSGCGVCGHAFRGDDVVSCRGEHGHAHARCATQRIPKFVPPDE